MSSIPIQLNNTSTDHQNKSYLTISVGNSTSHITDCSNSDENQKFTVAINDTSDKGDSDNNCLIMKRDLIEVDDPDELMDFDEGEGGYTSSSLNKDEDDSIENDSSMQNDGCEKSDDTIDAVPSHHAYFETVEYILNHVAPFMVTQVMEPRHQKRTTKTEFQNRKSEMKNQFNALIKLDKVSNQEVNTLEENIHQCKRAREAHLREICASGKANAEREESVSKEDVIDQTEENLESGAQYTPHKSKRAPKNVGDWKCLYRTCNKVYSTKGAMVFHMKTKHPIFYSKEGNPMIAKYAISSDEMVKLLEDYKTKKKSYDCVKKTINKRAVIAFHR